MQLIPFTQFSQVASIVSSLLVKHGTKTNTSIQINEDLLIESSSNDLFDLPVEIIWKIFQQYLSDEMGLLRCVHPYWKNIVDSLAKGKGNKKCQPCIYYYHGLSTFAKQMKFIENPVDRLFAYRKGIIRNLEELYPISIEILIEIFQKGDIEKLNKLSLDWPFFRQAFPEKISDCAKVVGSIIFECDSEEVFQWLIDNIHLFISTLRNKPREDQLLNLSYLVKAYHTRIMAYKPHLIQQRWVKYLGQETFNCLCFDLTTDFNFSDLSSFGFDQQILSNFVKCEKFKNLTCKDIEIKQLAINKDINQFETYFHKIRSLFISTSASTKQEKSCFSLFCSSLVQTFIDHNWFQPLIKFQEIIDNCSFSRLHNISSDFIHFWCKIQANETKTIELFQRLFKLGKVNEAISFFDLHLSQLFIQEIDFALNISHSLVKFHVLIKTVIWSPFSIFWHIYQKYEQFSTFCSVIYQSNSNFRTYFFKTEEKEARKYQFFLQQGEFKFIVWLLKFYNGDYDQFDKEILNELSAFDKSAKKGGLLTCNDLCYSLRNFCKNNKLLPLVVDHLTNDTSVFQKNNLIQSLISLFVNIDSYVIDYLSNNQVSLDDEAIFYIVKHTDKLTHLIGFLRRDLIQIVPSYKTLFVLLNKLLKAERLDVFLEFIKKDKRMMYEIVNNLDKNNMHFESDHYYDELIRFFQKFKIQLDKSLFHFDQSIITINN